MNTDIAALRRAQMEEVERAYQEYVWAYRRACAAPPSLCDEMYARVVEAGEAYTAAWAKARD